MVLRWIVLIISLVNPFFDKLVDLLPFSGQSMAEITARYDILFAPAGYAFSIWGLIYLAFIIYAIYQLLPRQRQNKLYDDVSIVFIIANMLGMCWQIAFRNDLIMVSLAIIAAMLGTSIIMYAQTRRQVLWHGRSQWLSVPFALYLAWLPVATIANIGIWLADIGWRGGGVSETLWTNIMIFTALLLSMVLSFLFYDVVIPMVATWAIIAIHVSNKGLQVDVATVALIAGLAGIVWCIAYPFWARRRRKIIAAQA